MSQKEFNRMSDYVTHHAGSGTEARWLAEQIEYENQVRRNSGKKPKVIKINTNPVAPGTTRIGNLAGASRGTGVGGILGKLRK